MMRISPPFFSLLATALLVCAGAFAQTNSPSGKNAPPANQPAASLPQDKHDGLTISVNTYTEPDRAKEKFGKANPLIVGILPVEIFLHNETLQPLRIDTSTIQLAVHFPSGKHQDIDWYVRVAQQAGARFYFVPEPLVNLYVEENRQTISSRTDWRYSMDWVKVTIAEVRQFDRCRYLRAHHHALICPDGLFDAWRVQPPFEKYFRFHLTQITGLSPAIPSHRGAFRDRHGRWVRDTMDAVARADERRCLRTAKSCGPDAPTLASSP